MVESSNQITYAQAYEWIGTIRSMIEHENALLNQRMTWMWTLQGLLFSAAGFLWDNDSTVVWIVTLVGLTSSLSIGYSLGRGVQAISDLLAIAKKFKFANPVVPKLPPTIGARRMGIQWLLPHRLLPWVFAGAWIAVIIVILL